MPEVWPQFGSSTSQWRGSDLTRCVRQGLRAQILRYLVYTVVGDNQLKDICEIVYREPSVIGLFEVRPAHQVLEYACLWWQVETQLAGTSDPMRNYAADGPAALCFRVLLKRGSTLIWAQSTNMHLGEHELSLVGGDLIVVVWETAPRHRRQHAMP